MQLQKQFKCYNNEINRGQSKRGIALYNFQLVSAAMKMYLIFPDQGKERKEAALKWNLVEHSKQQS